MCGEWKKGEKGEERNGERRKEGAAKKNQTGKNGGFTYALLLLKFQHGW